MTNENKTKYYINISYYFKRQDTDIGHLALNTEKW